MVRIDTDSMGQVHIIEAVLSIFLISSVLFVSVGALAPQESTISPEEKRTLNKISQDADEVMEQTARSGELKYLLLDWNSEIDRMNRSSDGAQTEEGFHGSITNIEETTLGTELLNIRERYATKENNVQMNIEVIPASTTDTTGEFTKTENSTMFLTMGSASQRSVVVTETVTLHGSDEFTAPPSRYNTNSLTTGESRYLDSQCANYLHELDEDMADPDCDSPYTYDEAIPPSEAYEDAGWPEDRVYNTVEVRLIAWI